MEVLKKKEKDLLDIIREHQPISKYDLWKNRTSYQSYSSVWNILEVLRLKGEITEQKSITDDNRCVTFIMIKKEEK